MQAFRVALTLHMRHAFHAVWALDGSKAGKAEGAAAAYGAWRGLAPESHPGGQAGAGRGDAGAATWGTMGARLPGGFESDDAECYAVLAALKRACEEAERAGRNPAAERVLLISDCAPVVARPRGERGAPSPQAKMNTTTKLKHTGVSKQPCRFCCL